MSFSPRQIDEMSLWEFRCVCSGWSEANHADDGTAPEMSDDRLAELGIVGFEKQPAQEEDD